MNRTHTTMTDRPTHTPMSMEADKATRHIYGYDWLSWSAGPKELSPIFLIITFRRGLT